MYIKRFESVEVSESIESCKDIIETISEYEDDIYIYDYKIGYLHHGDVVPEMKDERSKKVIGFKLMYRNNANEDGYKQLKMISEKSEIDELITLLQKSKSLINKFKIYCDDVSLETNNNSIRFLLKFENDDSEQKIIFKRKRILKSIENHFSDYRFAKTIEFHKDQDPQLFNYLDKFKEENINNNSYTLRFAIDIEQEKNKIFLTPKSFRVQKPYSNQWLKLKSDKILIDTSISYIKGRLNKIYDIDTNSLKITTANKSLEITTD